MSRARAWCFTFNNYTDDDYKRVCNMECKYLVVGKEVGEKKTKHLQGYVEFENAKAMTAVKKLIGNSVHLETRRGTPVEASDYCKKDDKDFFEKGEISKQGERVDIQQLVDKMKAGELTLEQIMLEHSSMYARYRNAFIDVNNNIAQKCVRTEKTECVWYFGKSGCGKSHRAFEEAGDATNVYDWDDDNGWWDNYHGQENVIIDEFRGQIPFNMLLKMCDKYRFSVKRRNVGLIPFTSKKIFITSVLRPEEVYKNMDANDSLDQLYRRIKVVHICEHCRNCTEVLQGNTGLVACKCKAKGPIKGPRPPEGALL